jgi:hypothetical protein
MAGNREAWFERLWLGMLLPIHWKGFSILLAEGVLFLSFGYLSMSLPERFNYAGLVRPACAVISFSTFIALAVLSFRHSQPRRGRSRGK